MSRMFFSSCNIVVFRSKGSDNIVSFYPSDIKLVCDLVISTNRVEEFIGNAQNTRIYTLVKRNSYRMLGDSY